MRTLAALLLPLIGILHAADAGDARAAVIASARERIHGFLATRADELPEDTRLALRFLDDRSSVPAVDASRAAIHALRRAAVAEDPTAPDLMVGPENMTAGEFAGAMYVLGDDIEPAMEYARLTGGRGRVSFLVQDDALNLEQRVVAFRIYDIDLEAAHAEAALVSGSVSGWTTWLPAIADVARYAHDARSPSTAAWVARYASRPGSYLAVGAAVRPNDLPMGLADYLAQAIDVLDDAASAEAFTLSLDAFPRGTVAAVIAALDEGGRHLSRATATGVVSAVLRRADADDVHASLASPALRDGVQPARDAVLPRLNAVVRSAEAR